MPEFTTRQPVETGTVERPTTQAYKPGGDHFALRFHGYVRVPADDCTPSTPPRTTAANSLSATAWSSTTTARTRCASRRALVRLKAGLHPITITFYEGVGDESLKVSYEGSSLAKQEIPPEAFYTRAPDASK